MSIEAKPWQGSAETLRLALTDAGRGLIEREALVETIALAAVAGEHLLVIGPPGTAKSEAVRRVARAVGGHYFEYLLGRFTEPSEIFGPIDLRRLREGIVETETAGMLPEAEIAFLDEVFLGSSAILNTLLGILNERVFRRGHTMKQVPLRVCVGASNALPEDPALAAFADRFLLRAFVEPIPSPRLEDLLEGGWSLVKQTDGARATIGDMDALENASRQADLGPVRPFLAHALRTLRATGILLTDRRAVRVQRLIAAAAILAGRDCPSEADLWPLILALPTAEEQAMGRESLRDLLMATENSTLRAAAEEASLGPLARAARLAAAGRQTLAARPETTEASPLAIWHLKLEGIVREIDAGFVPESLPPDLANVRTQIAHILSPTG